MWNSLSKQEYVDTGVIPLLSISAAKEMKMVVEQGEFIELLSGIGRGIREECFTACVYVFGRKSKE